MSFRILGLDPTPFRHLYGLSDDALAAQGAQRVVATAPMRFPDRVELRDLEPGERAILLNYEHQPANTPFRSRHAIFVREGAETAYDGVGTLPEVILRRPISLRAFDATDMMIDAELEDGTALAPLVRRMLDDPATAYLHAHFARRGCFAARIVRAPAGA